jgi:STE24 endopeptidase
VNEDKAARYHRLKRRADLLSLAWSLVLLAGLLMTGMSVALRSLAQGAADRLDVAYVTSGFGGPPPVWLAAAAIGAYVCLLSLAYAICGAPIAFYTGFVLERRYGLSNQRIGTWLVDQVKAYAIGVALAIGGTSLVYGLMAWTPAWWWLGAGLSFTVAIAGLTEAMPVALLPFFYRVKPLEKATLRARLLALADRVGARVLGAYEWGLSDKTKKANAALVGLGRTRRILVSDTMLAEYSDEEIEVVLAHELAHHVHGDLWKGILFESASIVAGLYLAAKALETFAAPLGLQTGTDVAGLPLLLLTTGALSLLVAPASHAVSRTIERRADRFALELTRNPAAFVSAMRRLGAQNLAEDRPAKIVQWLFYSHPPLDERIATAQAFQRGWPAS